MDYELLTNHDRAALALAVLDNVVFQNITRDEINASNDLAIYGDTVAIRDEHRYNVIWLGNLIRRLRETAKGLQDASG